MWQHGHKAVSSMWSHGLPCVDLLKKKTQFFVRWHHMFVIQDWEPTGQTEETHCLCSYVQLIILSRNSLTILNKLAACFILCGYYLFHYHVHRLFCESFCSVRSVQLLINRDQRWKSVFLIAIEINSLCGINTRHQWLKKKKRHIALCFMLISFFCEQTEADRGFACRWILLFLWQLSDICFGYERTRET